MTVIVTRSESHCRPRGSTTSCWMLRATTGHFRLAPVMVLLQSFDSSRPTTVATMVKVDENSHVSVFNTKDRGLAPPHLYGEGVNRRRGTRTKAELAAMGFDAPEYWLTGPGYCALRGGALQGVSETSKTGRKQRYYYCFNQRKKQCTLKPLRKDDLEARVVETAEGFLDDEAMLASLAVDMAVHYRETHERERQF